MSATIPGPARRIAGVVCDECESPDRCKADRLCWVAEQQAIREERAARASAANGLAALEAMDNGKPQPSSAGGRAEGGAPRLAEPSEPPGAEAQRVGEPAHSRSKKWTPETVIERIRQLAEELGHPPGQNTDTALQTPARRIFGSWASAVEAAGFARPTRATSYRGGQPKKPVESAPTAEPDPGVKLELERLKQQLDAPAQPPPAPAPEPPVDIDDPYEAMLQAADRLHDAADVYDQAVRDYHAAIARLEAGC